MAIGLLESFGLAEEYGDNLLTTEEKKFMKDTYQRKGCKLQSSKLKHEEIKRIIEIGKRCKEWKDKLGR